MVGLDADGRHQRDSSSGQVTVVSKPESRHSAASGARKQAEAAGLTHQETHLEEYRHSGSAYLPGIRAVCSHCLTYKAPMINQSTYLRKHNPTRA